MSSIIKVNTVQDQDGNNIINENANTITIGASGDTITIPAGATLANNGTATGFAAIDWQSTIVTGATHTASANQGIWINTTSNACNLTLPGSPSVGDQLIFSDFLRTWESNAVTLTLNGSKYQGNTSPAPVYDTNGETVHIVYSGSTQGWIPINDGAVANETAQDYTVDFLVIAGGGGGGFDRGGGGGAGGYKNSFGSESSGGGGSSLTSITLTGGATYTVTVGNGGAGSPSNTAKGTPGVDSSIAGSGITTVTSSGGGGGGPGIGGSPAEDGIDGGSGGGGGYDAGQAGSGTSGQGFAGAAATPGKGGGGGGVGATATSTINGGNGLSSSITGSAVTRGGGGGGHDLSNSAPPGGSGGGGNGGRDPNVSATDGTANTGSGGGGGNGSSDQVGGDGGKGVVIISMADANYSGTTSGSPTVAVNAGGTGKTVLTFNSSGSYTA